MGINGYSKQVKPPAKRPLTGPGSNSLHVPPVEQPLTRIEAFAKTPTREEMLAGAKNPHYYPSDPEGFIGATTPTKVQATVPVHDPEGFIGATTPTIVRATETQPDPEGFIGATTPTKVPAKVPLKDPEGFIGATTPTRVQATEPPQNPVAFIGGATITDPTVTSANSNDAIEVRSDEERTKRIEEIDTEITRNNEARQFLNAEDSDAIAERSAQLQLEKQALTRIQDINAEKDRNNSLAFITGIDGSAPSPNDNLDRELNSLIKREQAFVRLPLAQAQLDDLANSPTGNTDSIDAHVAEISRLERLTEIPVWETNSDGIIINDPRIIEQRVTQIERSSNNNGALNPDELLYVTMHRTVTPDASSTIGSFEGRGLGTHFLIGKDGTIYQTASLNYDTNHVANRNNDSIGIEVVGMGLDENGVPTDGETDHGSTPLAITDEGLSQYEPLTPEQADAVAYLTNSIGANYNLERVAAHEVIATPEFSKTPGEGQQVIAEVESDLILDPVESDTEVYS